MKKALEYILSKHQFSIHRQKNTAPKFSYKSTQIFMGKVTIKFINIIISKKKKDFSISHQNPQNSVVIFKPKDYIKFDITLYTKRPDHLSKLWAWPLADALSKDIWGKIPYFRTEQNKNKEQQMVSTKLAVLKAFYSLHVFFVSNCFWWLDARVL